MSTDDLPDLTEGIKTVTYPLGHYFAMFIPHTVIYSSGVKLLSLTALKLIAICANEQCEYRLVVVNKKDGTQEVRFNSNHLPDARRPRARTTSSSGACVPFRGPSLTTTIVALWRDRQEEPRKSSKRW